MIPPLVFTDSAAFTAGQQHERRRIGEVLRYRRAFIRNSHLDDDTKVTLIDEIEATMRAIEEAA